MNRDSGPCTDSVTQWYFDTKEKECRQFTYGGCRGNLNRFNFRTHCEDSCKLRNIYDIKLKNKSDNLNLERINIQNNTFTVSEETTYYENLSPKGK